MSDYEYSVVIPDTPLTVCIAKIGGGIVGQAYTGTWSYRITGPGVWIEGEDLKTGMPHTHAYVAALAPTFFYDGLDARWGDQISCHMADYEDDYDADSYDDPFADVPDTAQTEAEYDLP